MIETGLTKNRIISELTRSSHGDFKQYAPVAREALKQSPDFFAHLIAWNAKKGQVRDSKTALPLVGTESRADEELLDNALAHLALASPRDLLKALTASRKEKIGHWRTLKRLTERYLRAREANWFWMERSVLNFRSAMKELYILTNVKAEPMTASVLFGGYKPVGSSLELVANLKDMSPLEAAGAISARKIPFLVARGAMGKRLSEPDVLLAVMGRMSAAELTTNMKALEKMGVRNNPALRAALEGGLVKASTKSDFKATKAAEAVSDPEMKKKIRALQEKQADSMGVEGDWLVLADKSGSMSSAIETGKLVAATLARVAKGAVTLVFFDTGVQVVDVTGKTLEQITNLTKRITAGGGTSIGSGLDWALHSGLEVGGVAVVSDGGENMSPGFASVYAKYSEKFGKEVPVYFYLLAGEPNVFSRNCASAGISLTEFDLRGKVDYYSLPNVIQTMRTNRYSLADEIMATPLLSLARALKGREHDRSVEVVQPDEVFA